MNLDVVLSATNQRDEGRMFLSKTPTLWPPVPPPAGGHEHHHHHSGSSGWGGNGSGYSSKAFDDKAFAEVRTFLARQSGVSSSKGSYFMECLDVRCCLLLD